MRVDPANRLYNVMCLLCYITSVNDRPAIRRERHHHNSRVTITCDFTTFVRAEPLKMENLFALTYR